MLVCLANDSFVRTFGDIGYITNQLTRQDRIFDINGKIFLQQLTRKPKNINVIIDDLMKIYTGADREEIAEDFAEFVNELEIESFIVSGMTEDEINARMPSFSYSMTDVKTAPRKNFYTSLDSRSTTEFFEEYFRNAPQLFAFQFELTSRCNERCRHCYLPGTRNFHDMETNLVIDILDQLKDTGTVSVTFSGGECLLHKDFIPILKHARENDFSISVLSNLTLLNDEIISALRDTNINLLQTSVYSMNPEEHDYITQLEGSHAKTIKGLERLIAADVPVQISCPTMRKTYESYQGVLEWAYKHGIKGYTDYIMMARTDKSTDNLENRLTLDETESLLKKIINFDIEYRAILDSSYKPALLNPNEHVCGAGVNFMCVSSEGKFYPCAGFQGYPLGNAHEHSVYDAWHNSEALKKLRAVKWKDFPKCMRCEAKPYCSMCMVRNLNETGSIFEVSKHFCDVAFINKKLVEEYRKGKDNHV
ncbi:MAG: radical SAM protein [Synergistaceae bacterium]|nr:radical SAM protein [Synergistaceae bacterium]MBQ3448581.1 radical SAM protein [Synergistaceae bacterium]MBQ3693423.1 radical SAM protein [Synergistaceae bacterium]MBQ6112464.1 radical SAM protein [Synergistaceae bacterium]MBQ9629612.1 radical SAM protein [Synergistaceae bacterium]